MGRPRKTGLDHFAHDTMGNEKLDVFRALHGNDAYAFYFVLCELIYSAENAELDISDPFTLGDATKRIMVSVDRFNDLLASALQFGLFSPDDYADRGVITNIEIKQQVQQIYDEREKWRRKKKVFSEEKEVFPGDKQFSPEKKVVFPGEKVVFPRENVVIPGENTIFPREKGRFPRGSPANDVFKDLKDLKLLDQDLKSPTQNAHAHARDQAPEPFAYEGSMDVWSALNHYGINMSGFLTLDRIRSFQGLMTDDLVLAAIKESGRRTDSYCLKVLESWNRNGWRKLEDHPKHKPPVEGGEVVAFNRGRNQSQRFNQRSATAIAFEEIGKRSQSGKVVYQPRE